MEKMYSLGIDFGTNSVRALILDLGSGEEIASETAEYSSGEKGILLENSNPHLARQNPADYLASMERAVSQTVSMAKEKSVPPDQIVGIGTGATGSTPLPVDKNVQPLAFHPEFNNNLNAQAWLWRDHTSVEEAQAITSLAADIRPQYLKKCGGAYSPEWFFSKIFHCFHADRPVFDAAYSWIEQSDYISAVLCGIKDIRKVQRNVCAAGHKAMYNLNWDGLPDREFLAQLAPEMGDLRERLYEQTHTADMQAGKLCKEWAEKFGLPAGIPLAVGAIDAHVGAIGSGVGKGILVKIIGTSTCDIMVYPNNEKLEDIPGVAGIVDGSVLPGYTGIEAGQSAVGDIFNWFVSRVLDEGDAYHARLTEAAAELKAGQSGLLALDWNNGNRNILADHNLTGLLVGQTLHTADFEIYRALIEATAFGARRIIERMEEYGVKIDKVINCGGIAEKNPLAMQIYADVIGRPMEIAQSAQTVALGAAILGGATALKGKPGFGSVEEIQQRVCRVKEKIYQPERDATLIYNQLYDIYKKLHDAFGTKDSPISLYPVMKELLKIKRSV